MKVLFVGDSPTTSTGFSRCTRVACEALQSAGHDVTVLGMGYYGDPHNFPYPIYPCFAPYDNAHVYDGSARLPSMVARLKPDVVVILQDPWNIPEYFEALDAVKAECDKDNIEFTIPPIVGWIAIDSENQKGEQLERLSHVMVWTEFARKELVKGGYIGYCDIVPLGVDTDLFYPRDKTESRRLLGFESFNNVSLDSFVVGVVGRNQPRKRLDLTLEYFSSWLHNDLPKLSGGSFYISDAYLYLHVAPTGESSCDLKSLVKYHGLSGKVIVSEPAIGVGDSDESMPYVYSAFDVYMTQSQGEGWGLPALEAMACGVPCLLPGHSAFGPDGWACSIPKVDCTATALTAPIGHHPYTVGKIADKEQSVYKLDQLYTHKDYRMNQSNVGIELAKSLPWEQVGKLFVESLEHAMGVYRG